MKCSLCNNNLSNKKKCLLCHQIFCSYICIESHIILAHNKTIYNKNNNLNYNLNKNISKIKPKKIEEEKEEKEFKIQSPYLIPGILNIKRTYDQKYNLNNFIPIFEKDKPKVIGCGSFGEVFLVMNKINRKYYAIKHMEKKILIEKLNNLEGIYKEIYIQSRIDHPNILPILFVNETITDFDLVLEYSQHGNLFHYIRNNKSLNEPLSFILFIQVVNAVYFLHKNNLIHRDIKPENILLFDNNILKLCDFGWCVKLEDGQQRDTFCGTTEYMSPELVNHIEYSKEVDIWSLGVLLYEMVHGHSPFRPNKPNFDAKDVVNNIRLHKLKFKRDVSEECKKLIYHLLDENPNKRLKVEEIFNSEFVKYYEKMKFGFPDNYLVEKYKFKLIKFQNQQNLYYNINNNNNKYKSNNKVNEQKGNNNEIYENNNLDSKNIKNHYGFYPLSLSETNLIGKKRTKNYTTQFFHSLNNDEYKIVIDSGRTKAKSNSQNKANQKIPYAGTKIKTIIINNFFSNNDIKNNIKTKKNENIKYNHIIKEEINEEKKYNNKKNNGIITDKKNICTKQKITKIPIVKNIHHAHSPTNILELNSILNKNNNYLIFKNNNNSPTNKLNTEINISNNIKKSKTKNKINIIEINKNKFFRSPKIKIYNISNNIKKANTRNICKYNSKEILPNTNTNINININNANNIFDNKDDIIEKKLKNKKMYITKSLSHLKRKFNNNTKSMIISNINNHTIKNINTNKSINSENKKKNNVSFKMNKINVNTDNIKRIYTSMGCSPNFRNINSYNNHFIIKNFNNYKNKKNNNNCNNKNSLSPNISYNFPKNNSYSSNNISYRNKNNYEILYTNNTNRTKNFTKKKLLMNDSIEGLNNCKNKINLFKILNEKDLINKNKYSFVSDKLSKPLNPSSYNNIFNPIQKCQKDLLKYKIDNNNNLTNIKNNSNVISLKKYETSKSKTKNVSNNNIILTIKPKILSLEKEVITNENNTTRINLKNKVRNNSGNPQDLSYKYKMLKKLDVNVNDFFNNIKMNKKRKKLFTKNSDISFNCNYNSNASFNQKIEKVNTSISDKNFNNNYKINKKKLKLDIDSQNIQDIVSLRMNKNNKYSFCSRNCNKGTDKIIETNTNFQKLIGPNKTLNLDNKRIIIKKDSKIIISPILQKYKKDIINFKVNGNNKIENLNYINKNLLHNN